MAIRSGDAARRARRCAGIYRTADAFRRLAEEEVIIAEERERHQ
jgi:hypothetical protein